MADEDPRKLEEIRRFSAIYGRFDCKRKPEKPLTLHEVGFLLIWEELFLSLTWPFSKDSNSNVS